MNELRWLPLTGTAALAAFVVAAPARAAQYATVEEAAKRSFPDATSFRETTLQLSAVDARAVANATGLAPRAVPLRAMVIFMKTLCELRTAITPPSSVIASPRHQALSL